MSHNICVFNLLNPFYRGLAIYKIYISMFQKLRICWVGHQCAQLTRHLPCKLHCKQQVTPKIKEIIFQANIIHTQYRLPHWKYRSIFYSLGWHNFMASRCNYIWQRNLTPINFVVMCQWKLVHAKKLPWHHILRQYCLLQKVSLDCGFIYVRWYVILLLLLSFVSY